jgi:hypothetical protein
VAFELSRSNRCKTFWAFIFLSVGDYSMKTSVGVRLLVVASVALAPFAAFGRDANSTQLCVDAFVAQHFPGQSPIINVEKEAMRVPLALYSHGASVKLTAASRETGRLLATATCTSKGGAVKLSPEYSAVIVSAR